MAKDILQHQRRAYFEMRFPACGDVQVNGGNKEGDGLSKVQVPKEAQVKPTVCPSATKSEHPQCP